MTNEMQLRRRRSDFIEQADEIVRRAVDANKALTTDEAGEVDALLARAKALEPEIARLEAEARADVAAELQSQQRF